MERVTPALPRTPLGGTAPVDRPGDGLSDDPPHRARSAALEAPLPSRAAEDAHVSRRDPEGEGADPLRLPDAPEDWDRLIQGAGPASLLVFIESRMSETMRVRHAPEDILQEALLHAWRDRERCAWRGPKSFRAWLLAIIENRIRDAGAYESAQKRGGGKAPLPLAPSGSPRTGGSDASGGLLPF